MAALSKVWRRPHTSGPRATAEAGGAGLRRPRIERIGDFAAWLVIAYAVGVLAFAVWRARKPAWRFIASPAFTAAPAPGAPE